MIIPSSGEVVVMVQFPRVIHICFANAEIAVEVTTNVPSKLSACAAAQLSYNPRAVLQICRVHFSGGEDLIF